jgi:hypothetical protein
MTSALGGNLCGRLQSTSAHDANIGDARGGINMTMS